MRGLLKGVARWENQKNFEHRTLNVEVPESMRSVFRRSIFRVQCSTFSEFDSNWFQEKTRSQHGAADDVAMRAAPGHSVGPPEYNYRYTTGGLTLKRFPSLLFLLFSQ